MMESLSEAFERAREGSVDVVLAETSFIKDALTSDDGREALERAAKKTAIVVLQRENDSAADAQLMVEAVRLGVVDVIRYPLVKQNTANLWQHSVRKMMADTRNPQILETLRRSTSENDIRFSMPYRQGTLPSVSVQTNQALPGIPAAAVERPSKPPGMTIEAMNLRQAQLLAEMEARKLSEKGASSAAKTAKTAKTAATSAKAGGKTKAGSKAAKGKGENVRAPSGWGAIPPQVQVPQRAWNGVHGSSPDEHPFTSNDAAKFTEMLPIGLKLTYSNSFIKCVESLQGTQPNQKHLYEPAYTKHGDDLHRALGSDAPLSDRGTYPALLGEDVFRDTMDFENGNYDALDYVLNSTNFSLEALDDSMIIESLRDGIM